jgi:hypothetical protein
VTSTNLNKTIASYFEIPESNPFERTTWITRYPIAVKIEYWQNNQTKYSTRLFLLHLRIFSQEKVKVFNIEPVEDIGNLTPNEL